jgi:toxin secretion/phage lysis holin
METSLKVGMAIGGATASFLWGGWTIAIQALMVFAMIDYVTGVVAAGKEGNLSSRLGGRGIAKKVMIFLIVAVAHMVDQMLGDGDIVRDATITFYLCNEGLSIIENSGKMGLPVPTVITQAIQILKGKDKEEDKE